MNSIQVFDGDGRIWDVPRPTRTLYPVTINTTTKIVTCIVKSNDRIDIIIDGSSRAENELGDLLSAYANSKQRFTMQVGRVDYTEALVTSVESQHDTEGLSRVRYSIGAEATFEHPV